MGTPFEIAGLALGALGTISQGIAAERAGEFQARVAAQNARIARERAEVEEGEKRRENVRILAAQRAFVSKAGVQLEGTPLLVQQETAAEGEFDALTVRFGGKLSESRELARAQAARFGGRAARTSSLLRVGSTLLTGASKF
ncbi:MAG: hypothetical protein IH904_03025 [Proteobacteria bacterium]|nr:hypothetical protein [Pseudomonadota bacterium]